MIEPFTKEGYTFKIFCIRRQELEYGYAETSDCYYNLLQVKRKFLIFSWWETIAVESVPSFIPITTGTIGWLGAKGWVSKVDGWRDNPSIYLPSY